MKIGLVRRGFSGTGGAEAYLLRLAGGLAASGHEPCLLATHDWPAEAWPHGDIVRLPGATPTQFAAAFLRAKGCCDVTLSLDRTPGCDVFRAGDGVHAAWLQRRAAFEPWWKPFLRRWNPKHGALVQLEREVFRSSKLVIANSQMVATEIAHWYSLGPGRVRVVPNGIGPALPHIPKAEARAALGLPPDIFCVLFAGSGWERKGLRFAVQAVGSLPGEALLLVAGRGRSRPLANPRARFLGPTRDLPAVFSAADVFVLPTIYDPFSNACLEALASGLPVVTTTGNGFSEIMTEGVHGNIVPVGDIAGLAGALDNWRQADVMATSRACRELASGYSIERNVAATISALEEALAP